jgi:hypothetical protein
VLADSQVVREMSDVYIDDNVDSLNIDILDSSSCFENEGAIVKKYIEGILNLIFLNMPLSSLF